MHLFAKGTQTKLYIGKQADENTQATKVYPIPFNSTSLGSSTNMTDAETITGKRDARRPIMGNHDVTGSITVPLDTTTFGLYLAMGFKEDEVVTSIDGTKFTVTTAATIPAALDTNVTLTGADNAEQVVAPDDIIYVGDTKYVAGSHSVITVQSVVTIPALTTESVILPTANGNVTVNVGDTIKYSNNTIVVGNNSSEISIANNSSVTVYGSDIEIPSGSVISVNPSSVKYDHVFYVSDEMDSFTIIQSIPMGTIEENNATVQAYHHDVFAGCKLNSMSFEISGDGELTADLDIMGMQHQIPDMSSQLVPSGFVVQGSLGFDRIVAIGSEAPKKGNQINDVITVAKSFSTNIDFGLDGDAYFLGGDGYRGTISEGILKATGTLNCMLKDDSLLRKASTGEESRLSIQANGYEDNNYMKIDFANVMYEEATPGIEGPRGIAVDFNYHAYSTDDIKNATTAETSSVRITLRNKESEKYYAAE